MGMWGKKLNKKHQGKERVERGGQEEKGEGKICSKVSSLLLTP